MAHSLEVRVPFLDHEFVELAATIPGDLKVRGGTTKYLLKRAARGIIPDSAIDKRKVGFFTGAVGGWFDAQADRAIADYLLRPDACYAEMLDPAVVRQLVDRHRADAGRAESHLLLSILLLEVWLTTFLPRALAPSTQHRPGAPATLSP
jgi:asparagine synthase (glutamine-hydrolysing)